MYNVFDSTKIVQMHFMENTSFKFSVPLQHKIQCPITAPTLYNKFSIKTVIFQRSPTPDTQPCHFTCITKFFLFLISSSAEETQ